jgi:hypothetical protein
MRKSHYVPQLFFAAILLLGNASVKAQYWDQGGSGIYYPYSVGIGTSSPAYKLDIRTTELLEGINISHNDQKAVKIHSGSLHAGAYNNITQNGDGGIIYGGNPMGFVIAPWAAATSGIRMDHNGYVGIGTPSPVSPLSLSTTVFRMAYFRNETATNTNITVANNSGFLCLGMGEINPHAYAWSSTNKYFIGNDNNPTLFVDGMSNGSVSIGTQDAKGYMFAVNGNAIFNKVVVKPYPWADYVFQANYRLRPLSEVEQYINQYHHLPEVPTAEEVEKNGIDVGDNQATLLKKIEELTLYVIEQHKKQQEWEQQVKLLKEEVNQLKGLLESKINK